MWSVAPLAQGQIPPILIEEWGLPKLVSVVHHPATQARSSDFDMVP